MGAGSVEEEKRDLDAGAVAALKQREGKRARSVARGPVTGGGQVGGGDQSRLGQKQKPRTDGRETVARSGAEVSEGAFESMGQTLTLSEVGSGGAPSRRAH